MVNLDYYTTRYFENGLDAKYELREGGIVSIHPVLVKDYKIYEAVSQVLLYAKNESNDINLIRMSYLQFLIEYAFKQADDNAEDSLRLLLKLCLGYEYVGFIKRDRIHYIAICDKDGTITKLIAPDEFDDLSKIILNQNDAHYDNRIINPEVRAMMEEVYKIKYRDITPPNLEKKKAFVCSKMGKTFREIGEFTYREFEEIYSAMLSSEIYLATKITEASFKYEVKNPSKHPLYEKEKDRLEEVFSDTSVLQNKGLAGAENIGQFDL